MAAASTNFDLKWPEQPAISRPAEIPLDLLPTPAAVVDPEAIVLAANPDWRACHPTAVEGASVLDWCSEVLRRDLYRAIQRAAGGGQIRSSHDYTGPDGFGRRIVVSAAGSGAILIDQEASQADDRRRKRQAEKMETVGRLVGGVAHDFANLLTLIAGYTDILLNRVHEKDPIRPELDEIRKAANRGARLTSQLLGFTRGQSVEPQPLNLNAVVADLQRMLGLVVGEHVNLETNLSADLDQVVADPGQMEQVIMNLILNARDAMLAGGRIRIETANGELSESLAVEHGIRPGPCVTLSISDTGHGIEPEAMSRIFEPFFTTKEKGKGTGLGLSTVHRIVKESGGDIWAQSAPGEGTTFTICLPRAPYSTVRGADTAPPRVQTVGSETVLLVEDEDGVRRLLHHVLHKRGYKVIEAANGAEALRLFERRGSEIQLVLTDMVMPQMGGRELGERLRALSPEVKIIYMSGYTDDVLVRTGALGPGMSFLQKPLRPEVLAAKVRETLDVAARRT
jgi:two-component system, cell cycle sensor histidine kinase and response regulator CckA